MNAALAEHGTQLAPVYERPPGEDAAQESQINVLALAWKARWLIVLGMLLGGLAAWAYLQRVTPRYTSVSRIMVEPRILSSEYGATTQIGKWLPTQTELIQSNGVLSAALESPEVQELSTIRQTASPLGVVKSRLRVGVGQNDDLISVSLEIPSAKDAAVIVNAIVDAYIANFAESYRTRTTKDLNVLLEKKRLADGVLEEQRNALDDFRRKHVALSVQVNNDNVINRRFAGLSEELNATELELLQAKARYNRAMRMYESPQQRPYLMETAISQHSTSRTADLSNQVREVEQQLTVERSRWGDGYPRVRMLKESLDSMKSELAEQQAAVIEAYVDSLRQDYEILTSKRDELQRAFEKQFDLATEVSGQVIELDSLEAAVQRAAEDVSLLAEQIKRLELTEEVGGMTVSVIDVAAPSTLPSYPSRERFLATGLALGGLLGFGLAFLRDLLEQRLRSLDEISRVMQLPIVGVIPFQSRIESRSEAGRIVATQPRCTTSEAIRTLRTSVYLGLAAQSSRVFVVTSPAPGDGKSTVASNLAIAMAQVGRRVLLIDADMRKPTQHEIFAIEPTSGLASILTDRRPADEAIVRSEIERLDLLPCGRRPSNPAELLNDGYFASLLDELALRYDRIVIDSPPILPVADARALAAMADCTLLVLRAESSTRRMATSARDELWRVRAQRIGLVVNGVPARKQGTYGYGESSYGYGGGSYGDVAYGHADEPDLVSESRTARPGRAGSLVASSASAADDQ